MKDFSGYRLLWMQVIFDLPVLTKKQRKLATKFRNNLLDEGFTMSQFSVYLRHIKDKEQALTYERRISLSVPPEGKVNILIFTDKQFEQMKVFTGKSSKKAKSPDQLMLF